MFSTAVYSSLRANMLTANYDLFNPSLVPPSSKPGRVLCALVFFIALRSLLCDILIGGHAFVVVGLIWLP